MTEIIQVHELKKSFMTYEAVSADSGSKKSLWRRKRVEREVLHGLNFTVHEGEIVGFLGPNGAGKSTAIKIMTGILYPTSGKVLVLGYVPWKRAKEYRREIAVVMGQKSMLWPDLPAMESFSLYKSIYGVEDKDYRYTLERFIEMLDVRHLMNVQVRRLSLGERMKMELIAALLHSPKVLFLDEPTIGLDIQAQKSIRTFIREYNKDHGATIILTSHQMQDIEELCHRAIIINKGNLIYDGTLADANALISTKKLLTLHFHNIPERAELERIGVIRQYDDSKVTLEIPKKTARECLITAVNSYDVLDFEMQDIPLEETLELIYQTEGSK